jgi:hypothetical protein
MNLNKENFFDEMSLKYPMAMHDFNVWIDAYKKSIDWDELFNEGEVKGDFYPSPKFHDIPYEMQVGILMRFATETFKEKGLEVDEMKTLFESCLIEINDRILHKSIKDNFNGK